LPLACRSNDVTRDELSGDYSEWRSRVHRDDIEQAEAQFQTAMGMGRDYKGRFRIVRRDGRVRHIDARTVASRDHDGNISRILGVNLDITDHIENEQRLEHLVESAQAANKAKAEFLATMSHEIRTPMNGVIGMTNLLMNTPLQGEQREYVETIRTSGESLLTLINDILDFSKMEAGKLTLEKVPFSIERVSMETISLFATQAESKGVKLSHDFPSESVVLIGDPLRVRQILLNLISNALKFTSQGEVNLTISLEKKPDQSTTIKIRVTDTGIGMSKEHLSRLGEAFVQADASTTRQFGGTGLGLSICRSLVELMRGTMRVESTLGEGTSFELLLPFEVASAGAERKVAPSQTEAFGVKLSRVLVAEDNLVNQRIITLMLKNFAQEVVVTGHGREALEAFRVSSFDCVLMDGHMPEMDGLEATRQIREFERLEERKRTPIIALTANALQGDRETFLAAGMDEYLTKPIRPNDLASALRRIVLGIEAGPEELSLRIPENIAPSNENAESARRTSRHS
jgi:PAS domain S-box-containing protein